MLRRPKLSKIEVVAPKEKEEEEEEEGKAGGEEEGGGGEAEEAEEGGGGEVGGEGGEEEGEGEGEGEEEKCFYIHRFLLLSPFINFLFLSSLFCSSPFQLKQAVLQDLLCSVDQSDRIRHHER